MITFLQKFRSNFFKCNKFTGYKILSKINDTTYGWKCQCRYPSLFQNDGVSGDCTSQTACNGGKLICPKGTKYCNDDEQWTDKSEWNPTFGVCSCKQNTVFLDKSIPSKNIWSKKCVYDSCLPGTVSDKMDENGRKVCNCPVPVSDKNGNWTSYIKCPENVWEQFKIVCENPLCLTDPCNPNGYYDSKTGMCICNNGFVDIADSQQNTKHSCLNPCAPEVNFCGNRGTCIIKNGKAECTKCKTPYLQNRPGYDKDPNDKVKEYICGSVFRYD